MLDAATVTAGDRPLETETSEFDVIVLGAGMTGLAAADRLSASGRRVLVIEAEPEPGGLLRSFDAGGSPIEAYYHHVFPQDVELRSLIARLGLGDRFEWRHGGTAVVADGSVHDFDTPLDLLRFEPLSPYARLRLAAGSAAFVALGAHRYEQNRIGELGPRVFGQRGFGALWQPLLVGKFGEGWGDVSAAWLRARMRQRVGARRGDGDRLGYIRGGFGLLVERYVEELRHRIAIECGAPGTIVARTDGHWRVAFGTRQASAPAVVAAVAVPPLDGAVALPVGYAQRLAGIPYRAIVCALVELDRPLGHHYWYNLTDPTPFGCLAVIEHTNFVPPEWYGGRHLAYLAHYVAPDSAAWTASAAELVAAAEPAFRAINPEYRPDWVTGCHLSRDRFAQPVPLAGGPMPGLPIEAGLPGVFHAGLAHIYPDDRGVSLALRLGERVATAAGAYLGGGPTP